MSHKSTAQPATGWSLRWAALAVGLGLAVWGCDSKGTTAGKLTPVKAEGDPVALLEKNGSPYITANVADDVPTLTHGDAAAREDALIRKAVQIALERGAKHKPYEGKDLFLVRLIVLHELDEYGKPKAGSSLELATVEVPRASLDGLTADRLTHLSGAELRQLVRNPNVNLGNLDKFA